MFTKAVVVDVLNDPAQLAAWLADEQIVEELSKQGITLDDLTLAPRNSILARVISAGGDKRSGESEDNTSGTAAKAGGVTDAPPPETAGTQGAILCYPIFSSHFAVPIKPSEVVWLVATSGATSGGAGSDALGRASSGGPATTDHEDRQGMMNSTPGGVRYWLSRVPGPITIEDTNYSHADRVQPAAEAGLSQQDGVARIPDFANGTGNPAEYTLGGELDFETIIATSVAYQSFTAEPVPVLTKRPGDLVLQGSNNTAIILGEDRGWSSGEEIDTSGFSNATYSEADTARNFTGTIDLVAGRGRHLPKISISTPDDAGLHPAHRWGEVPTSDDQFGETPIRTAPWIIQNTRSGSYADGSPLDTLQGLEADRHPERQADAGRPDITSNRAEGDPDFVHDSSRVYISMNTDADANFGLTYPNVSTWPTAADADGTAAPDVDSWSSPASAEGEATSVPESPHVVLKSDNIRIIARQKAEDDPYDGSAEIKGSIRIIKEGTADSEGGDARAVIMIEPDGTIMIDGPTIIIGSGLEKANGLGKQVIIGRGATEPMVLGNTLAELLQEFFDEILSFLSNTYDTHIHPGAVPMNPPMVPSATDQSAIEATKANIKTILSKIGKTK